MSNKQQYIHAVRGMQGDSRSIDALSQAFRFVNCLYDLWQIRISAYANMTESERLSAQIKAVI